MTHDVRFDDAAQRQCAKDIGLLDECNDHTDERGSGRLISCLYEKLPNITESSCRYFINQLQVVVFNDHRLSEYFRSACQEDIEKNKCGRLDDENEKVRHENRDKKLRRFSSCFSSASARTRRCDRVFISIL